MYWQHCSSWAASSTTYTTSDSQRLLPLSLSSWLWDSAVSRTPAPRWTRKTEVNAAAVAGGDLGPEFVADEEPASAVAVGLAFAVVVCCGDVEGTGDVVAAAENYVLVSVAEGFAVVSAVADAWSFDAVVV